MSRHASRAVLLVAFILLLASVRAGADTDASTPAPRVPTRRQLIGAWRLIEIRYTVDGRAARDPFYQPHSTGLIVYDESGWMSVQIGAPHRQSFPVPATREVSPRAARGDRARVLAEPWAFDKLRAFDSYYAYGGTWEFDEATSVATHQVQIAMLPAESGAQYTQRLSFEGGHLLFTNGDAHVSRVKVWERVSATP